MSMMVDEPNSSVDPESEVKKLQDLVKKLEQQNQILRSKQNQNQTQTDSDKDLDKKSISKQKLTNAQETETLKDELENLLLDDELIDVDNSINDDDENWLYASPKRPTPEQKSLSPYKWVRKEFDNPSPEVESAKKSLLYRLDVVGVPKSASTGALSSLYSNSSTLSPQNPTNTPSPIIQRYAQLKKQHQNSYSSPQLGALLQQKQLQQRNLGHQQEQSPPPEIRIQEESTLENDLDLLVGSENSADANSLLENLHESEPLPESNSSSVTPCSLPQPSSETLPSDQGVSLPVRQPKLASLGTRVDTNTFTRPKKNRAARAAGAEQNGTSDESDKQSSSTKDDLDLSLNKLEDVVDVQVLARMQEESLRQSFTPLSSPRRSFRSGKSYTASPLSHSDVDHSPRSSPSRLATIDGCNNQIRRSNNSLASNSSHSTASSPPDSPYGSQYLEQSRQTDHRRSLPNLARGLNASLQPHNYNNESKLGQPGSRMLRPRSAQNQNKPQSGVQSKPGLASPKSRASTTTSSTTNSQLKAASPTRALSPQRSGIPSPRGSNLPRPGSAGPRRGIPTPTRKSGLAKPSRATSSRPLDDSWKDGCF